MYGRCCCQTDGVQIVIVTTTGRGAPLTALQKSLARHAPDHRVRLLLAGPRPIPPVGADWLVPPQADLGPYRRGDLLLCHGAEVQRFAALAATIASGVLDEAEVLVLPEWAWCTGPLSDVEVEPGQVHVVPEWVDSRDSPGGRTSGGLLIPEVTSVGRGSSVVANRWLARLADLAPDATAPVMVWGDLVAVGGDVSAMADRSLALSPASLGHAPLLGDDAGWTFGGDPIRVASFPGFEASEPWWYAEPGDVPLRSTADVPGLRTLCRAYADELGESVSRSEATLVDHLVADPLPGVQVTPGMNRAYGQALFRSTMGGPVPPNPYLHGEAPAFLTWWAEQSTRGETGVSTAVDAAWTARGDLHSSFPEIRGRHQRDFRRWLWTYGLNEGLLSLVELPDPPRTPTRLAAPTVGPGASPPAWRAGVNLVGYHSSEVGLGVAVRRVGRALDAAHIPWQAVNYDRIASRQTGTGDRPIEHDYPVTLVLITPDQLGFFVRDGGGRWLNGHHVIGLWFWESDVLTATQRDAFHWVDEVWASTRYLRDAFASAGKAPVHLVPVPLEFDPADTSEAARLRLGLDDRFTVLFSFDFLSVVERKNPLGLIEAFRRAFPEPGRHRLILKSINGELFPRERERILDATAEHADVELWDGYFSAADRMSLVALADVYASLHRSEGLGLTLAEAVSVGTPVLASRYSGPLDFLDDSSAVLVGGREIRVGPGQYYPAEGHWFDPDLDEAAAGLRALADDPALGKRLAAAAAGRLEEFSAARVGSDMARRLGAISLRPN